MNIAKMMKSEFDLEQRLLSGIEGVGAGSDTAECFNYIFLSCCCHHISHKDWNNGLHIFLNVDIYI
jgi:hypothetical protein